MYNIPNIRRLQIELTTRCNASCPACSRNLSGGPVVPGLELLELTLTDIKQMFPTEILKNLCSVNYCGNLGDPGLVKDIIGILEYFKENSNQNLIQYIRTNGGMRGPEHWAELAKFFQDKPKVNSEGELHIFSKSAMVFSVDGLKDTNHIYRRGVMWDKVIANMTAFSEAGGYGVWEWLIFGHNEHQLDEARELADKLGFHFVVKTPVGFGETDGLVRPLRAYTKEGNYDYSIWPAGFTGEKIDEARFKDSKLMYAPPGGAVLKDYSSTLAKESTIKCKSIENEKDQEIFVTASGHILPCCYLGAAFGQQDTSYSRVQFNQMIKNTGLDHFDLRKHSLLDILNGNTFGKFFTDSWASPSVEKGKMLFCVEVCGEKSAIDRIYAPGAKIIPIQSL